MPGAGQAQVVTALTALNSALNGARHADVLAAFRYRRRGGDRRARRPDAGTRLSRIVSAYGRVATRVAALPASATKDAAQLALGRFQSHSAPALGAAPRRGRGEERDHLGAKRAAGDGRGLDGDDGRVRAAAQRGRSMLRDLVAAELEPALQPVRFLFTSPGNLAAPVGGSSKRCLRALTR